MSNTMKESRSAAASIALLLLVQVIASLAAVPVDDASCAIDEIRASSERTSSSMDAVERTGAVGQVTAPGADALPPGDMARAAPRGLAAAAAQAGILFPIAMAIIAVLVAILVLEVWRDRQPRHAWPGQVHEVRPQLLPLVKVLLFIALVFDIAAYLYSLLGLSNQVIVALLLIGLAFLASYMVLGSYLVVRHYRGRALSQDEMPRVQVIVRRLADKFHIPVPRVVIISDPDPNAFAIGLGLKRAVIGLNTGLLDVMNDEQLEGVIAHEMAHIRNRDTMTSTMGIALLNTTKIVALVVIAAFVVCYIFIHALFSKGTGRQDTRGLIWFAASLYILAPAIALVGTMFMSRRAEYRADRTAGLTTGKPDALASALRSMAAHSRSAAKKAGADGVYSGLWINAGGHRSGGIFSTHPPVEERERRLMALAAEMGRKAAYP
jgi:heat shock protein HtpX